LRSRSASWLGSSGCTSFDTTAGCQQGALPNCCPTCCTYSKGELFFVGSGSPYEYAILDSSVYWGMSVQEATAVAREAVFRATYRDAYSGNNVDL
ncbi:hypothetical protein cypCar_00037655, partial [Cyprinus carpio]